MSKKGRDRQKAKQIDGTAVFDRPWLDWPEQLKTLEARGLQVSDSVAVIKFLSHVNYYRFKGYCQAFQINKKSDLFVPGTTFEQIREAYDFDRELRDLVTEALELVEIDVRTNIAHRFGGTYGPFGHTAPENFYSPRTKAVATATVEIQVVISSNSDLNTASPSDNAETEEDEESGEFDHAYWLHGLEHQQTRRSKEKFITDYRKIYAGFPRLPVWMVTELISFGGLSMMFKGMLGHDRRVIADRYEVPHAILGSWLHHLVYVRNVCAHHSRLWDREWDVKPKRMSHWDPIAVPNHQLFITLLILRHLLARCPAVVPFEGDWKRRIETRLAKPPSAQLARELMGLPVEWPNHPLWR